MLFHILVLGNGASVAQQISSWLHILELNITEKWVNRNKEIRKTEDDDNDDDDDDDDDGNAAGDGDGDDDDEDDDELVLSNCLYNELWKAKS